MRPTRVSSARVPAPNKRFNNVAENYLTEHTGKHIAILAEKKDEMAELDAELEDMMNVAADGNYNLKILNDAFEGRAHENEDIELVRVGGEMKIKKRTKRPPRPVTAKVGGSTNIYCGFDSAASGAAADKRSSAADPRLEAIMEEVMQRTAAEFTAIDAEYEVDDDDDNDSGTQKLYDENEDASNCMALVPVTSDAEFDVKRRRRNRELLKMQAKAVSTANPDEAKVLYDIDDNANAAEGSTFVTGIGIPGKTKKQKRQQKAVSGKYDEEHKFHETLEEELMEQVDKTE